MSLQCLSKMGKHPSKSRTNLLAKNALHRSKLKLLVIGDNAFDIIVKAQVVSEKESNIFPEERLLTPAGSGINFAFAAARLGLSPFYFTPISKDPFGQKLELFLKENRIDHLQAYSYKDTPLIFTILNTTGDRNTIAMIQNTSYTDISCKAFENLQMQFDWAYISGGIITESAPQKEVLCIAKLLASRGVQIFFDPQFRIGKDLSGFLETSLAIINVSSYVFMNDKELLNVPAPFLNKRISEGTIFVIKKGKNGAEILTESFSKKVHGLKVAAIDTTGAGDIFNAAFMKSLSVGKSHERCLEYANTVAALSTEKLGIFVPEVDL